jgi:hypothetical protein
MAEVTIKPSGRVVVTRQSVIVRPQKVRIDSTGRIIISPKATPAEVTVRP